MIPASMQGRTWEKAVFIDPNKVKWLLSEKSNEFSEIRSRRPRLSGNTAFGNGTEMHLAEQLIKWQKQHGRHDLPWQKTRDPYRRWISEIMLQQTQVTTVIPYYLRFIEAFPDVRTLAAASEDDVLRHWAGLGYYARGRNLLACAKAVMASGGEFPKNRRRLRRCLASGDRPRPPFFPAAGICRRPFLTAMQKRVLPGYFGVKRGGKRNSFTERGSGKSRRKRCRRRSAAFTPRR